MTRPSFAWALCAALAACIGSSTSPTPRVMLDPILDSLFVGDQIPPPAVTYFDGTSTQTPPPSQIVWSSSDANIMTVEAATGQITGRQRGLAVVIATINNTQAGALIVVSDVVDITLLADALYLLPNDTITIPTIILHKDPTPPTVSYDPSPDPTVYTVDASGLVRATAATTSGPVSYTVHAGTAQASGAVYVVDPNSVGAGNSTFSVLPGALVPVGGPVQASNYPRTGGNAFRLEATHATGTISEQQVQVTLTDAVVAPGPVTIDTISPGEAAARPGPLDATCSPPRAWALWTNATPTILGYSRTGGEISVTRIASTISGGQVIGGRFTFPAQRGDAYANPLGVVKVYGVFVAPLVTDPTVCQ